MTTYYAAPEAGSGGQAIGSSSNNGLSQNSPFRIVDFWDEAGPGDELKLLDGHYKGANSMITPPLGLSGSSGSPITISAFNDGGVLIDGEFARTAGFFRDNSWWEVQGMNFRHSPNAVLAVSQGSTDINFRRIVVWDRSSDLSTTSPTASIVLISGSGTTRIKFIDAGFFGVGRKVWSPSQGGVSHVECHRCWMRYEGQPTGGCTATVWYSSSHTKLVDCLITYDAMSVEPGKGQLGMNVITDHDSGGFCTEVEILGTLAYTVAGQRITLSNNHASVRLGPAGTGGIADGDVSCILVDHSAVVVDPAHPWGGIPWFFSTVSQTSSATKIIRNVTSIGKQPSRSSSNWDIQGLFHSSSIPAVGSSVHPWTQSGSSGANLCKFYGTSNPKWPFPMNARIKAATQMAGAYSGPCVGFTISSSGSPLFTPCTPIRKSPRTADVTQDIQNLLGPIPASCWNDANLLASNPPPILTGSTPQFPTSTTVPSSPTGTPSASTTPPIAIDTSGNFVPNVGDCTNASRG